MAANPGYYKSLDNLTKQLVSSLVSFPETSENFEAVTEYSLSNFKYHKFLSVDNKNVAKHYENLEEKLIIHSNTEKANAIKKCMEEFLTTDICSSAKSNSDVHYSMLALIFKLSNDVLNPNFTLLQKSKQAEVKDHFDWASYLMEDIDKPSAGDFNLEDLSDAESDFEEEDRNAEKCSPALQQNPPSDDKSVSFNLLDSRMKKSDEILNELSHKIVLPYWNKQKCQKDFKEKTHAMRIALTFGVSNVQTNGVCLDESIIVREILFMLMGQSGLTVFPVINGKHSVSEDVVMSHVTPESLRIVLTTLCAHADTVQDLQNFVFDCPQNLLTYKAFAHALLKYIQKFRSRLLEIQKKVIDQKETVLITDVLDDLNSYFRELTALQGLFDVAFNTNEASTNAAKASKLIGALYTLTLDQWLSMKDSSFYNELIAMWLATIKPYIDIIDRWITRGILNDPFNEFVIKQEVKCVDAHDNEFWLNAVSIKSEEVQHHHAWFAPILNDIILAGKSMEVLESTGTLFKRLKFGPASNNNTIYSEFIDHIYPQISNGIKPTESNPIEPTKVELMQEKPTESDRLFQLSFQRLRTMTEDENLNNDCENQEHSIDINVPLPVIFTRTLFPLITSRCEFVNMLFMEVIVNECQLKHHLDVIQKFHLMGWGDVMYDFNQSVFEKISCGEYWRDLSSLNGNLQYAVLDSNPNANPNEVRVRLNHANLSNTNKNDFVNATDIIELEYRVEWPINLVITPDGLKVYNTVFCYLLKVKRALYSLVNLHFKSLLIIPAVEPTFFDDDEFRDDELSNEEKAHRLSLLRAEMLRLVSHWHNFIMTKVIMAEKQTFMTKLQNIKNLEELRAAHDYFLNRLVTLCLLETDNKGSKFVQGTLEKILHLSVVIHSQWRRGVFDMSTNTLQKYELQYKECSEFLSTILQHISIRGAVPLLESLAYFFVL